MVGILRLHVRLSGGHSQVLAGLSGGHSRVPVGLMSGSSQVTIAVKERAFSGTRSVGCGRS